MFQDREELAASTDLACSVREALKEAHSLIVICSTSGARSRWVDEEVREFARLGRRDRIQCLIVPEPGAAQALPSSPSDLFPPALLDAGHEPLAADARASGDGKRAAFLKLVAGITGVRYDELRQREQVRRHKRLFAFATAASIGFLLMAGLSIVALIARADALRERDIARQQSLTAQRTVDFVKGLFQVSDPSEAKGRSITALEVLDRGSREIQGQLTNEPDVKAELVTTLSEVYMGLGSFRRADALIKSSLGLKVSRAETRARQLGALARSQGLQANYDASIAYFEKALALIANPEDLQDPTLYPRLLIGRAEALSGTSRFGEAARSIQTALRWDESREGNRSIDVARDLEAAGLNGFFSGNTSAARANYTKALAIRLPVTGRLDPQVSQDLSNLGSAAYLAGDLAAAENYWRQSLAIDQQILGPDHPDLGSTLNNLGRVMLEQRKFAEAARLLTRSANIYLGERSDTHDDLAFIFSNLALAKEGLGSDREAKNLFERALNAANVHHNRLIAPIMVDLADLECSLGDSSGALEQLARAAPIMKAQYPDDEWRSAWVENSRGACLVRKGDPSGKQLVETSAPVVLKRWKPGTMYGLKVEQRLRLAASAS